MPWKEKDVKNLRREFVLRSLYEKQPFKSLCQEYGIQPKTGYKWKQRFIAEGISGLGDRSRRPQSSPNQLAEDVICGIIRLKMAHHKWGPRKIREIYERKHAGEKLPSESSFKRVLNKAGLVEKRHRRPSQNSGRIQSRAASEKPNDVWTVDFKGWWHTAAGERCEPLTVRDDNSRYILCISVPENGCSDTIRGEFERLFYKYGLPGTIRSDNGVPFASAVSLLGLSKLSVWWLSLGIDLDRIDPGKPYQNGGHERMHRDIAAELENQVSGGLREQAAALEIWRRTFNEERPHEALGMRCPAEVYRKSTRRYDGTPKQLVYPSGYLQRKVHVTGKISIEGEYIRLSTVLAGWNVGLKFIDKGDYSVYFGNLCLGQIQLAANSFIPAEGIKKSKNTKRSDIGKNYK